MRTDVEFQSGGERCAAWLYLPESTHPAPIIVMAHGLGAVRSMRLDAFAERYCAEGYACLVFDYRYFGDSSGEPRQLLSIKHQLEDWANAVKFVQKDKRVDNSKVIIWGSSFSGGHVLKTAANVPGVAGVMSQCPFTNGLASTLALHPVSSLKDQRGIVPGALASSVELKGNSKVASDPSDKFKASPASDSNSTAIIPKVAN